MNKAQSRISRRIPLIPNIPAAQFALIEPDLYAGGAQGFADPLRCRLIL